MKKVVSLAIVLMFISVVKAEVPYIFTNHTDAIAEEVNYNFSWLEGYIQVNTLALGTLEAAVSVNSEIVTLNSNELTSLNYSVSAVNEDLTDINASITATNSNLSTVSSNVATNSTNININSDELLTLGYNVSINNTELTNSVSDNDAEIDTLGNKVSANYTELVTVNADLTERISTNTDDISSLETYGKPNIPEAMHDITFDYVDFLVGHEFPHGGYTWKLVLFNFIEFSTGDAYTIKMPIMNNVNPSFFTYHDATSLSGNITVVDGITYAVTDLEERRSYLFSCKLSTLTDCVGRSNLLIQFNLRFQVGETVIAFKNSYEPYGVSRSEMENLTVSDPAGFDFTMPLLPVVDPTDLFDDISYFISHIKITKVT